MVSQRNRVYQKRFGLPLVPRAVSPRWLISKIGLAGEVGSAVVEPGSLGGIGNATVDESESIDGNRRGFMEWHADRKPSFQMVKLIELQSFVT